jgi:hypothetical protein
VGLNIHPVLRSTRSGDSGPIVIVDGAARLQSELVESSQDFALDCRLGVFPDF